MKHVGTLQSVMALSAFAMALSACSQTPEITMAATTMAATATTKKLTGLNWDSPTPAFFAPT
jgi:hypothetical protein